MKHMENKMDDLFKSQLNHLPEEFPSEQDWSALKKELNNAGLINKKDNKKRKFFFWMFGGLLITGFAAFAVYKYNADDMESKKEAGKETILVSEKQNSEKENIAKKSILNTEEHTIVASLPQENVAALIIKKEEKNTIIKSLVSIAPSSLKKTVAPVKTDINPDKEDIAADNTPLESLAQNTEPKNEIQATETNLPGLDAAKTVLPMEDEAVAASVNPNTKDADTTSVIALKEDSLARIAQVDTPAVNTDKNEKVIDEVLYRKFWGGAMVSLDYDNYKLKAANEQGSYILNSYQNGNEGSFKYSAGLSFGYRPNKWFAVSTDVLYSQKKTVNENFKAPDSFTVESNFNQYHYYLQAKYLDVIVKPRIYVWHKKCSAYVFPGVAASFNIPGAQGKSYFTKAEITKDGYVQDKINLEFLSAGFSLLGGFGIDYELKNNWKISGEISYRQSLTPVIQHATYTGIPLTFYLNSVNAGVGIYKYF